MNLEDQITLTQTELAEYGKAILDMPEGASLGDVQQIVLEVAVHSGVKKVTAWPCPDGHLHFERRRLPSWLRWRR